jgi:PAS domain S-box-containing protein
MTARRKPSAAVAQIPAERQDEAAFQAESRMWERTFNSVPDMIAILDCQQRIVRLNRPMAEKLGRTPEQCVGLTCYECVHDLSQPPSFCPNVLALADGQPHSAEVQDDNLGGYFLVTATPLRDEEGRIVGTVHVARDINEQKKAQEILRHLLEASDHRQQLVSCDIHDGLAQQLAGALMQFETYNCLKEKHPDRAAKALDLAVQMVRDAHAEARRLIGGLRPPQLEEGGVVAAIEGLVQECNRRNKVKIEFRCNVPQLTLSPSLENTVFRIVQECIANACRHSKSKKVKVDLTHRGDQLRIEVRDWGIGFQAELVNEGHFGLEDIQERARIFGGRALIKSSPRKGTDIVVELPLHAV